MRRPGTHLLGPRTADGTRLLPRLSELRSRAPAILAWLHTFVLLAGQREDTAATQI